MRAECATSYTLPSPPPPLDGSGWSLGGRTLEAPQIQPPALLLVVLLVQQVVITSIIYLLPAYYVPLPLLSEWYVFCSINPLIGNGETEAVNHSAQGQSTLLGWWHYLNISSLL